LLLEVNSVNKKFGGLLAVDNVSFQIAKGEIVGLIGPNGAGKTTLFNLVTGFYQPDRGQIRFKERSIIDQRPDQICGEGLVKTFQIVQPFFHLTVSQNVIIGALCRSNKLKEARRTADKIMSLLKLIDKKDTLCADLTYIDQKRVELAKTLATEPELLLLDEVVAGLTPTEVDELMAMIREIHAQGITLFIVEHVMKVVMGLCTRILVMHHGKLISEGTPQKVSSDPAVIEAYLGEGYNSKEA
jgi:branched-chain amino acid transport system ATP-binding protein